MHYFLGGVNISSTEDYKITKPRQFLFWIGSVSWVWKITKPLQFAIYGGRVVCILGLENHQTSTIRYLWRERCLYPGFGKSPNLDNSLFMGGGVSVSWVWKSQNLEKSLFMGGLENHKTSTIRYLWGEGCLYPGFGKSRNQSNSLKKHKFRIIVL